MSTRSSILPGLLAAIALHGGVLFVSPAGAAWRDNGVPLGVAAGSYGVPATAPDGLGGMLVAWVEAGPASGPARVRLNRMDAQGNLPGYWPQNGRPVVGAVPARVTPAVCGDGAGGMFILWTDLRAPIQIYALHLNGQGLLIPGWPAGGIPLGAGADSGSSPQAVPDGHGGALVAWSAKPGTSGSQNVCTQRVMADGTVAPGWPVAGVAVSTRLGAQQHPVLTPDDSGGVIVACLSRGGTAAAVCFNRVRADGSLWPSDGMLLSTAPAGPGPPVICPDGGGGACVVFSSAADSSGNLYALHADRSGNFQWGGGPVPLCAAHGLRQNPAAAVDPAGSLVVSWAERAPGTAWRLQSQRVGASGRPSWPSNGVTICALGSSPAAPAIQPDLTGGAILAWRDDRTSNLSAQRVDSTGTLEWSGTGVPVTTLGTAVSAPALCAGPSGGTLWCWSDSRPGAAGIYANFVDVWGRSAPGTSMLSGRRDYSRIVRVGGGAGGDSGFTATISPPRPLAVRLAGGNPSRAPHFLDFELPQAERARLEIFDARGARVRTLLDATARAGPARVEWDGRTESGQPLPGGVYFARLSQGAGRVGVKLVHLR